MTSIILFWEKTIKRRSEVEVAVEKRKAVEQTVDNLHDWVDKLHVELVDTKASEK